MSNNFSVVITEDRCFHLNNPSKCMSKEEVTQILTKHLSVLGFDVLKFVGKHDYVIKSVLTEEEKQRIEPNTLYMYHWTRPFETNEDSKQADVGELFGMKGYCTDHQVFYSPTGTGIPIVSPEGIILAEYHPDIKRVFILYDMIHYPDRNELRSDTPKIMEMIMEQLASIIATGQGLSLEEINKKKEERLKELKRSKFINYVKSLLARQTQYLKDNERNINANIAEYKEALTRNVRELKKVMDELSLAETKEKDFSDKMIKEFESVTTIDGIIDFTVEDGKYVFMTDTLYFYIDDHRFLAGEYKITVDIMTTAVTFTNLTPENRRKSYWGDRCHHPHVNQEGKPCLGNVVESLAVCNANNEIAAMATMLKSFIESVNPEDGAGKYYPMWDCVDENGKKIPYTKGKKKQLVECNHCGHEGYIGDDIYVCDDCGEYMCSDCYTIVANDDLVCDSCLEDNYSYCYRCGEWHKNDRGESCKECYKFVCAGCSVIDDNNNTFCSDDCRYKYEEEHPDEYVYPEDLEDDEDSPEEVEDMSEVTDVAPTRSPIQEAIAQAAAQYRVQQEQAGQDIQPPSFLTYATAQQPTEAETTTCGCGSEIPQEYMCESCGKQGCSECITRCADGVYRCEECR